MSQRIPRRATQTRRTLAAGVLVAGALAACDGDDSPTAENVEPSAATTVEDVGDTTGTADAAAISATTTPATAPDPTTLAASVPSAVVDQVAVQYAGLTWSVEGTRFVTENDSDPQERLHVDLLVENANPFGMRWPIQVVALRRADGTALELDGQVGSNASRLEVPAHDRIRTTLTFEVEEVLELSELSLTVAETDRIPAVAWSASAERVSSQQSSGHPD